MGVSLKLAREILECRAMQMVRRFESSLLPHQNIMSVIKTETDNGNSLVITITCFVLAVALMVGPWVIERADIVTLKRYFVASWFGV